MRAVNSSCQFPSGIMCSKSWHVRTVTSHFVEIAEVLNIETWQKGRLPVLESIVSEVKCDKTSRKR